MALIDDLRQYIAVNGHIGTPSLNARALILAEFHGTPLSGIICRELLHNPRYRYFANESFLNATKVRSGVREYLYHRVLPTPFGPGDAGLDRFEQGKRILVPRFAAVLDDLRQHPRYILNIGSSLTGAARNQRLAKHFLDEIRDRGLSNQDRGILLVGAAHAAAVPFDGDATTTRMILERYQYKCASMLLLSAPNDSVVAIHGEHRTRMDLTDLLGGRPRLAMNLRQAGSPFYSVKFAISTSSHSLASQYEYAILGS
jgi:hypothetical protein